MSQTAYQRAWYLKNRERLLAKAAAYHVEHRPANLAYYKAYRERTLEESRTKSRAWKAANLERHRESSRRYNRDNRHTISEKLKSKRRALKTTVLNAYGGHCACCGDHTYEFLTLDHIDGDGANHRRTLGCQKGRSEKFYAHLVATHFPPGYRVLCFNCNSARGFYGYCPHQPHDTTGIPPTRRRAQVIAPAPVQQDALMP